MSLISQLNFHYLFYLLGKTLSFVLERSNNGINGAH